MGEPTITVVIPTHRRLDVVRRSVGVLLGDAATREIVVVDTSAGSEASAWVAAQRDLDRRMRCVRAAGMTADRARQAGLEAATGAVVLFLDDDVAAVPGLVSGHAKRGLDSPGAVVVGPTPPAQGPGAAVTAAERVYAREYERRLASYGDGDDVLGHLWGGNFSLPRDLALEVGFTSGEPLPYHEDRDFGLRCRTAGASGVLAAELAAPHHHRRSNREGALDARRRGAAMVLLAQRHPDEVTLGAPGRAEGRAGRLLLRACRPRRARSAATALLAAATELSRRTGARRSEEVAYKLWRRIEEQQGHLEQRAAQGEQPSSPVRAGTRERVG